MPTKPGTTLKGWATDANYSTGPKSGSPTKQTIPDGVAAEGHRPGKTAPTAAEYWNWWLNVLWLWIDWLRQGSAVGAANAHLLETGTDGRFQVEGIDVVAANTAARALKVDGPPGAGNAVFATSDNAFGDATIYAQTEGAGAAIEADAESGAGSAIYAHNSNVDVPAILATGNPAIQATSVGSQEALRAAGSATSTQAAKFTTSNAAGMALLAQGGASAPAAAMAEGGANSPGFYGKGGTSSGAGVVGEARHNAAFGVHGKSKSDGITSAAGVRAEGLNAAPGLYATGVDGPGVFASSSSVARGAIYLNGQASDPSSTVSGDVAVNTSDGMYKLVMNSTWCGIMWRRRGSAGEVVAGSDSSTTNDFSNPVTVATRALTNHQAPKYAGKVLITATLGIGRTGTCSIGFDLVDVTAATTIKSWTLPLYQSGGGVYERETCLRFLATLPASGNRTWRIDMYRVGGGGGDTVRCRDVVLSIDGTFE